MQRKASCLQTQYCVEGLSPYDIRESDSANDSVIDKQVNQRVAAFCKLLDPLILNCEPLPSNLAWTDNLDAAPLQSDAHTGRFLNI